MEIIQIDDVHLQIVELKKLVRVVDPGQHATLFDGGVRALDFQLSRDLQWVEASAIKGLSFATTMKKFKELIKLKKRFVSQVDVYAIDEFLIQIDGMQLIHDRPGHASLVVTKRMRVADLIERLEQVAARMEVIGRMWVSL